MRWRGTCGALTAALLFQAAVAADCPFERAHYVFKGHRRVTAEFVPHAKLQGVLGRVFVKVTVKPKGWTYWYYPETGNGYSMIRLISPPEAILRSGRGGWPTFVVANASTWS